MEWQGNTINKCLLKKINRYWKECNYRSLYENLKEKEYDYTIEKFDRDFCKISSMNKFCYLIYLLSKDYSVKNVILVCNFLTFTDTFFYDIHVVIKMIMLQALNAFPRDKMLLEWIISIYEGHPDSPFSKSEIDLYKKQCIN